MKNIVMNVQWVKCTHPCRKIYLPERGVFYRAVKVMEFLAPTYSLLLKDKHIKFYKVRNSVTWSVLWATTSTHTAPRLCFFLKNFIQRAFCLNESVSVGAIFWLKMSPNGERPNIFDQHSLHNEITRISLPLHKEAADWLYGHFSVSPTW